MKKVKIKKYKLIKTYPTSPKLGSEVDVSADADPYKDFPDNWQDITPVKLDYQILSLARFCSIKPIITNVSDYGGGFVGALLKCDGARIHSVKRLSDGEIFTLGDKVNYIHANNTIGLKILKIYKDKNDLKFVMENCSSDRTINVLKHVPDPIPLFKTEDGFDIYEGDTVWHTNLNPSLRIYSSTVTHKKPFTPVAGLFSTKEKAEEYILMNKPCLSINNVLGIYNDPLIKSQLIKLIKNKK